MLKKEILTKMRHVYDEFGLDIHNIPPSLQSQVNNLVKEIIKLRENKSNTKNT